MATVSVSIENKPVEFEIFTELGKPFPDLPTLVVQAKLDGRTATRIIPSSDCDRCNGRGVQPTTQQPCRCIIEAAADAIRSPDSTRTTTRATTDDRGRTVQIHILDLRNPTKKRKPGRPPKERSDD